MNYLRKVFVLFIIFINLINCSTPVKNYHATVTITNNCSYSVYYNVYKLDENCTLDDYYAKKGTSVIDRIHGPSSPLASGSSESVDINWAGTPSVYLRSSAGKENVYQTDWYNYTTHTTKTYTPKNFVKINDAENKTVSIIYRSGLDNTTDINY